MRLVAGIAFDVAHVILRYDLGESGGLGQVGFVTTRAQHSGIRQCGNDGSRVCDMLGQGSMTGLAVNSSVLAGLLEVQDIAVTVLAGGMSGEARLARSDFLQRVAAIVAVLPKALGHE